jgi:Asparagine synthase
MGLPNHYFDRNRQEVLMSQSNYGMVRVIGTSEFRKNLLTTAVANICPFGAELRVAVYGDILGAYYEGRVLTRAQALQFLANSPQSAREFLKSCIGDFCVIYWHLQSNRCEIYTSVGGHGLFYCQHDGSFLISDVDYALTPFLKPRINEMEVLHLIINRLNISPFTTIVDGLHRVPGGCHLAIDSVGNVTNELFLGEPSEESADYAQFADRLDGQSKVIALETKERKQKIVLLLSGGIDSSVIALSLANAGADLHLVTTVVKDARDFDESVLALDRAARVAQLIGAPWDILECDRLGESYIEEVRRYNKTIVMAPHERPFSLSHRFSGSGQKDLVVGGHMMDKIHSIRYSKIESLGSFLAKRPKNIVEESYCMYPYQKLLLHDGLWSHVLSPIRRWAQLPDNCLDYVMALIVFQYQGRVVPAKAEFIDTDARNLFFDFANYKKETVLRPMLTNGNFDDLVGNRTTPRQLSLLLRRVSYAIDIQWWSLVWHIGQRLANVNDYLQPASQGPLLDYFFSFPLTWRDIVYRKRLFRRYFLARTGRQHEDAIRSVELPVPVKTMLSKFRAAEYYPSPEGSSVAKLLAKVDVDRSAIFDHVKQPAIRHYIERQYKRFGFGTRGTPASCRGVLPSKEALGLYQIEMYLKQLAS